jgi:hypothetical protein
MIKIMGIKDSIANNCIQNITTKETSKINLLVLFVILAIIN